MSGNFSADGCARASDGQLISGEPPGDSEDIIAWRKLAASLARVAISTISTELTALNSPEDETLKGDARLKALMSLTKSIQSLEDMINRMENAIDAADRYPDNIVEFREKLERQIAALVDERTEI